MRFPFSLIHPGPAPYLLCSHCPILPSSLSSLPESSAIFLSPPLSLLHQCQGFPTLLQQPQPLQQQQRSAAPTSGAEVGPSTVQCGLLCLSLPFLPTLGKTDMAVINQSCWLALQLSQICFIEHILGTQSRDQSFCSVPGKPIEEQRVNTISQIIFQILFDQVSV